MKKGDVVIITDGSWTRSIVGGKLVEEFLNDGDEKGKQYIVIETGCSFPKTGSLRTFNNTVIQAIDSDKVVFIEERFLELVPPKHKIIIDITVTRLGGIRGNVVEISDKLYQEIKRDSQN